MAKCTMTRMQVTHEDDDVNKPKQYTHYIKFGDNDDGYYDLSDMEMTGYLKWDDPDEVEQQKKKAAVARIPASGCILDSASTSTTAVVTSVAIAATSPASVRAPVAGAATTTRVVTPSSSPSKKRKSSSSRRPQTNNRNVRVKVEPSQSNYQRNNNGNDTINMQEFEHWLRNVHRGAKGGALSEANVRSVMNRVRDLVSGRGVSYKNWPPTIKFYVGSKINLTYNFENLLQEAKRFEEKHGRDKGNGWLLQHPIKKLLLYKEHLEEFGNR